MTSTLSITPSHILEYLYSLKHSGYEFVTQIEKMSMKELTIRGLRMRNKSKKPQK